MKYLIAAILLWCSTMASAAWFFDAYGIPRSNVCRSGPYWAMLPVYGIIGTQCYFTDAYARVYYGVFSQE